MLHRRLAMSAVLMVLALLASSCTLAKPLIGAVTAPAYLLASDDCNRFDSCTLPCGVVAMAAAGAVGGFVTGVISDIYWLTGKANDPVRNIHDPFATNVGRSSITGR